MLNQIDKLYNQMNKTDNKLLVQQKDQLQSIQDKFNPILDFTQLITRPPTSFAYTINIQVQKLPEKTLIEFRKDALEKIESSPQQNLQLQFNDNQQFPRQKYQKCLEYFQNHKIDQANQLATQLYNIVQPRYIKQKIILSKIKQQHNLVVSYTKQIKNSQWILKAEKQGVKISSRLDSSSIAVLIESDLNVPIQIFISIVIQFDLYYKFMPFMEYSKLVKDVSRNSKIGHCINNFPIIDKRESYFQGLGYDRLDFNNTVFLCTRSIHNNPKLLKQLDYDIKLTEGAVQLEYKFFVVQYTPKTRSNGYLKLGINVDMKLDYVPNFILDFSCRQFGFDFFQNIVKLSQKFEGSEWQVRIKKNPSVFNFFKQRIEQYLKKYDKQ